ncbi:unnamed protein product, partial [Brassica oleracea]
NFQLFVQALRVCYDFLIFTKNMDQVNKVYHFIEH